MKNITAACVLLLVLQQQQGGAEGVKLRARSKVLSSDVTDAPTTIADCQSSEVVATCLQNLQQAYQASIEKNQFTECQTTILMNIGNFACQESCYTSSQIAEFISGCESVYSDGVIPVPSGSDSTCSMTCKEAYAQEMPHFLDDEYETTTAPPTSGEPEMTAPPTSDMQACFQSAAVKACTDEFYVAFANAPKTTAEEACAAATTLVSGNSKCVSSCYGPGMLEANLQVCLSTTPNGVDIQLSDFGFDGNDTCTVSCADLNAASDTPSGATAAPTTSMQACFNSATVQACTTQLMTAFANAPKTTVDEACAAATALISGNAKCTTPCYGPGMLESTLSLCNSENPNGITLNLSDYGFSGNGTCILSCAEASGQ